MKAKRLTIASINRYPAPKTGRAEHWDSQAPGLGLRITATGAQSWCLMYRFNGELRRDTLGEPAAMSLEQARQEAIKSRAEARAGHDPRIRRQRERSELQRTQADTLRSLCEEYLTRYAKKANRSWSETQRIFSVYVLPYWGDRPVSSITRLDVVELLNRIQDGEVRNGDRKLRGGAVMADATLAQIRKLFNWYAAQSDTFNSPIVKGMGRAAPVGERARERTLTDDEIRLLWACTCEPTAYNAFIRQLVLTGQRRSNVAGMDRAAIDGDGVWKIEGAAAKGKRDLYIPLSPASLALVASRPRLNSSSLLHTTRGAAPISGFSKAKRALDKMMLDVLRKQGAECAADPASVGPMPRWTLHDLRRTARTLMSRDGVSLDIAEITLGHKLKGVRAIYDRHTYLEEKRDALQRLANVVDRIVNPPPSNVAYARFAR